MASFAFVRHHRWRTQAAWTNKTTHSFWDLMGFLLVKMSLWTMEEIEIVYGEDSFYWLVYGRYICVTDFTVVQPYTISICREITSTRKIEFFLKVAFKKYHKCEIQGSHLFFLHMAHSLYNL